MVDDGEFRWDKVSRSGEPVDLFVVIKLGVFIVRYAHSSKKIGRLAPLWNRYTCSRERQVGREP